MHQCMFQLGVKPASPIGVDHRKNPYTADTSNNVDSSGSGDSSFDSAFGGSQTSLDRERRHYCARSNLFASDNVEYQLRPKGAHVDNKRPQSPNMGPPKVFCNSNLSADINRGEYKASIPETIYEQRFWQGMEGEMTRVKHLWNNASLMSKDIENAIHSIGNGNPMNSGTTNPWEHGHWNSAFTLPLLVELKAQKSALVDAGRRVSVAQLHGCDDDGIDEKTQWKVHWANVQDERAVKRRQMEKEAMEQHWGKSSSQGDGTGNTTVPHIPRQLPRQKRQRKLKATQVRA